MKDVLLKWLLVAVLLAALLLGWLGWQHFGLPLWLPGGALC